MFFDIFEKLCKEKGISPTQATIDCGAPKSNVTYWKKSGSTPNSKVLANISNYFNVSVDYLLGKTDERNKTAANDEISEDDIMIALFGGDSEYVSEDAWNDVKNFARKVAEIERKKKEYDSD